MSRVCEGVRGLLPAVLSCHGHGHGHGETGHGMQSLPLYSHAVLACTCILCAWHVLVGGLVTLDAAPDQHQHQQEVTSSSNSPSAAAGGLLGGAGGPERRRIAHGIRSRSAPGKRDHLSIVLSKKFGRAVGKQPRGAAGHGLFVGEPGQVHCTALQVPLCFSP